MPICVAKDTLLAMGARLQSVIRVKGLQGQGVSPLLQSEFRESRTRDAVVLLFQTPGKKKRKIQCQSYLLLQAHAAHND